MFKVTSRGSRYSFLLRCLRSCNPMSSPHSAGAYHSSVQTRSIQNDKFCPRPITKSKTEGSRGLQSYPSKQPNPPTSPASRSNHQTLLVFGRLHHTRAKRRWSWRRVPPSNRSTRLPQHLAPRREGEDGSGALVGLLLRWF